MSRLDLVPDRTTIVALVAISSIFACTRAAEPPRVCEPPPPKPVATYGACTVDPPPDAEAAPDDGSSLAGDDAAPASHAAPDAARAEYHPPR